MGKRDEFVENLKAQLDDWNDQINHWQVQAREASGEAQAKLQERMDALLDRRDEAKAKLAQLQQSSEGAFEELKLGAEDVWQRTKDAFAGAREWFEEE